MLYILLFMKLLMLFFYESLTSVYEAEQRMLRQGTSWLKPEMEILN